MFPCEVGTVWLINVGDLMLAASFSITFLSVLKLHTKTTVQQLSDLTTVIH